MRILKSGQEQTWLTLLSVDGAIYSVNEDEPVFLTIRTSQQINYVRNNLDSFTLDYLGLSIPLQLADLEIIDSLNLVSGGFLYTYRLLCKKSTTDFTPKSWYKTQYTTLNNRYGHLSGQLQVAEYQVTNLLGSYGSFSTDSNSDGLADGLTVGNTTGATATYSLSNGQQRVFPTKWTNTTGSTKVLNMAFNSPLVPISANSDRYFVRCKQTITITDTNSSMVSYYYFVKVDLVGGTPQYNAIQSLKAYTQTTSETVNAYGTFQNNGTNTRAVIYLGYFWADNNYIIPAHTITIHNYTFVNLTTMGDLPSALKQFFAPSNIQKWEDFAIFGNTNVMCILKDSNGNYIAKRGNDWLNDLIPYVENTANIRMPVYV